MKWIICFKEAKNLGIWRIFTKHRPQFGHVFAVQYDPELDTWYHFEYATQRFNFGWSRDHEADLLVADLMYNCVCLQIESQPKPIYLPRWLYCVSFVKHICGINKPWILTPYQLYCELLKLGGKDIFLKPTEGD
jgi:hypothetical protein